MIQLFFTLIFLIIAFSIAIYSLFYEKKNLITVILFLIFSIFSLFHWFIGIFSVFLLFFYKKYSYGEFITINMFAAALLAWFFFNLFYLNIPLVFYIALASVISICFLAIFGIFEKHLKQYLLLSNIIQILFVVLDLTVTKMFGEYGVLSTIQIFNYTFAGLTFFLTIGVFAKNKNLLSELEGSYFASRWNDIFATIGCLSLAGLPAFNIFVSEWFLFTHAYFINPIITVLGIFAALLLFVMYYKVVYVLVVGEGRTKKIPRTITILNGILALICILLGLLPQLQFEILTKVVS